MTTENQVNGKGLITNGSINPSLSLDELLLFDMESKRQALHYFQVDGHYPGYGEEIDQALYEPLQDLYTQSEIESITSDDKMNEALQKLWNRLKEHRQQMIIKTEKHDFDIGMRICETTKQLNFGGEFRLTKGQLLGFIWHRGNWNGFKVEKGISRY